MTYFLIVYALVKLVQIAELAYIFTIFSGAVLVILGSFYIVIGPDLGEDETKVKSAVRKLSFILMACFCITMIFPSKEQVKITIGGGLVLMAADSEFVKGLPERLTESIDYFLASLEVEEVGVR